MGKGNIFLPTGSQGTDLPNSGEWGKFLTSPGNSDPEFTKGDPFWDVAVPGHSLLRNERKVIHAPGLSEQEKVIIARMKELSMGDPELGKMYEDFTFRALDGEEGVTPGLKRDLAEQEAITKEEIARGLGSTGDIQSTGGIKRMGRFREKANTIREQARQDAIRKGEGLMSSRARRMVAAAGTALGPMAQQRGLESMANLQTSANVAQERAGLMQLGGQFAGKAVTDYRRTR